MMNSDSIEQVFFKNISWNFLNKFSGMVGIWNDQNSIQKNGVADA